MPRHLHLFECRGSGTAETPRASRGEGFSGPHLSAPRLRLRKVQICQRVVLSLYATMVLPLARAAFWLASLPDRRRLLIWYATPMLEKAGIFTGAFSPSMAGSVSRASRTA